MEKTFHKSLIKELDSFQKSLKKKYPEKDLLTMDLHSHDHNSSVPDELLGRILGIPETWLPTEKLLESQRKAGCDTFTITNHNNGKSCFHLQDKGFDILTGGEFSCFVPDFNIGIHVLAYGFTPSEESKLIKLRKNLYKFLEFTTDHDIPTIWAHPLFHYKSSGMPEMAFFEKMALHFERFEVLNGQRDTWQNMLIKNWVESLSEEKLDEISKKHKVSLTEFCKDPYKKHMSGGSDSHMGIFSGLTGTKLYLPDLSKKLKVSSRSELALEALRNGHIYPFGAHHDDEKMMVAFIDYFCQIGLNMKDPGLIRMLLHKGSIKDKIISYLIVNGFSELRRHKMTSAFLKVIHSAFQGEEPGLLQKIITPKAYKPVLAETFSMARARSGDPLKSPENFKKSIDSIYTHLNKLLVKRIDKKIEKLDISKHPENFDFNKIIENLEIPSSIRDAIDNQNKKSKGISNFNLEKFLDGLSFPFLGSMVVLSASYTSARVLYNTRPLLKKFSAHLGKLKHPERALWLTDTFEDKNGVSMVLNSLLSEIQKRKLPIDILVCSSTLKPQKNLIVVPPLKEFTLSFYENQPMRIPNIMDIHRIFKEGEYDRVICSTEGFMGIMSLFLKEAYTVPAYFYIHTDWMMFIKQVLNFDSKNRDRLRRLLRAFYRAFDGLFVLNKDQQKWLSGSSMNIKPSKVNLTAHWTEDYFRPTKASKKKIFKVDDSTPVILFAGRISHEKGVMEIPGIYKAIKEKIPQCRIAFAGTGPEEEKLKKLIPDGIFTGWVNHKKLPDLYSSADMLILPSKFDTFGCVVLEALKCGLPVTAYNTKGPKDIITNNKNGFVVKNQTEMGEKIIKYLSDKKMAKEFRKNALALTKDYSADIIIEKLMSDLKF